MAGVEGRSHGQPFVAVWAVWTAVIMTYTCYTRPCVLVPALPSEWLVVAYYRNDFPVALSA